MMHVLKARLHTEQRLAEPGHHRDEDTYARDSFELLKSVKILEIELANKAAEIRHEP